jgi:hypothetical protein
METAAVHKTGEKCIVCEMNKENGIHLWDQFLCVECEREIINTDPDDEQYQYYLRKLKSISLPKTNVKAKT